MSPASTHFTPEIETKRPALDLLTLLRILIARRRFLLLVSFGTALLFFVPSLFLPNTYKASALVMPPDHSSSALSLLSAASGASGVPGGALAAFGMKSSSDLYVALMLSPPVEDMVIQRFDLKKRYRLKFLSQTRQRLESIAQVSGDGKSGIISVSMVDKDPVMAADLANGLVQAYDVLSSKLAITDAARRRLFFERQIAETKESLSRAEEDLKTNSAQSGIVEPAATARAIISYEAQLRAQIASKTVELQSMRVFDAEGNPQLQTAERELQGLKAQADALSRKADKDSSFSKTTESSASLDYTRRLREVRYNESLFELLLKNLEVAKLDEAREGNVVQIISLATPPEIKDGPHRTFFGAAGFVLGLLGSSISVLLRWAREAFAAA